MRLKQILLCGVATALLADGSVFLANQVMAQERVALNVEKPMNDKLNYPDVLALRYYARNGENDRYEAELRRLRDAYPQFVPPSNILADPALEEKPFWKLFGDGQLAKLREQIDKKMADQPGWRPSDELVKKLKIRETREEIGVAIANGKWNSVIEIANKNPDLIQGEDIEILWFVAQAFGRLGKFDKAMAAFETAISVSIDDESAAATIHKASVLMSSIDVAKLYGIAVDENSSEVRRETVSLALVRGTLERILENGQDFPPQFLALEKRFHAKALADQNHTDIGILAWAAYRQRNFDEAVIWFSKVDENESDAKYIEGKILALKQAGRVGEALAVASRWRNTNDQTGALYINLASISLMEEKGRKHEAEFVTIHAHMSSKYKSGEGAEALGWYAFNLGQYQTATAWFSKAIEWDENESRVFGLVLTAAVAKDQNRFLALQSRYGATYPKIATMDMNARDAKNDGRAQMAQARTRARGPGTSVGLVGAYQAGRYKRCIQLSTRLINRKKAGAQDYQMRGWCFLKLDRPREAQEAFAVAVRKGGKGRADAAYGESLAALRTGYTDSALRVANSQPLKKKNRRVIDLEILVQRARSAFSKGDYHSAIFALDERRKMKTEPRDLGFLRGWSLYHLGDLRSARGVFASLDAHFSTKASRRALSSTKRKIIKTGGQDR